MGISSVHRQYLCGCEQEVSNEMCEIQKWGDGLGRRTFTAVVGFMGSSLELRMLGNTVFSIAWLHTMGVTATSDECSNT